MFLVIAVLAKKKLPTFFFKVDYFLTKVTKKQKPKACF